MPDFCESTDECRPEETCIDGMCVAKGIRGPEIGGYEVPE